MFDEATWLEVVENGMKYAEVKRMQVLWFESYDLMLEEADTLVKFRDEVIELMENVNEKMFPI